MEENDNSEGFLGEEEEKTEIVHEEVSIIQEPKISEPVLEAKETPEEKQEMPVEIHEKREFEEPIKEETEEPAPEKDEINLTEIKEKATTFFKNILPKGTKGEEQATIDTKQIASFWKRNVHWIVPLLLIFIAIGTSTHFRMMTSDLPITDQWAEESALQFYRSNLGQQINQQYPNLPQQNRELLLEKELQSFLEQNAEQVEREIAVVSQQYKAQFQNEDGETYLLAIDPYLWYSQTRNVLEHGHLGDTLVNGVPHFSLRDGRLNKLSTMQLHPYIAAYTYKVLSIFSDISVMRALFLLPAILIGLALIPAFFIGRKISGNVGGFFAAMFLAVNASVLGRTPAGFADTDAYSITFPLFVVWFFIEAYMAKDMKKRLLYGTLSGLTVGLYAATWSGWSYIFLLVLGVLGVMLLIELVQHLHAKKSLKGIEKQKSLRNVVTAVVTFIIASGIFVSLFQSFQNFSGAVTRVIKFTTLKEVGIKSIWPNVLTTVAEFNTVSFSNIAQNMGGQLLFFLAILGIVLTLVKKKGKREYLYFILLAAWMGGTAYSFTKGARFALLIGPPFAVSLGVGIGIIHQKASAWLEKGINLHKYASNILLVAVFALLLISPLTVSDSTARNQLPSMNDAWHTALTNIKEDTPDSIITSWWDFGHWFVAIGERRVTFDGGDQGQRIHWVGRSLVTDDEKEAIGILRMLNCVQETAPAKLDEFTGDSYESIQILDKVLPLSRQQAIQAYLQAGLTKEQVAVMIDYTHCTDLLPNYYITSEDMVSKAGVWGHFGSWDFQKATMYQNTKKLSRNDAVTYLTTEFGLSEQQADSIHNEIQTTDGDRWISPWPGYLGMHGCVDNGQDMIRCGVAIQGQQVGIDINTKTYDVSIQNNANVVPNSIVYTTQNGVVTKELTGQKTGFSIVLIPNGDAYRVLLTDPLQAASTFTKLFYLDGHGLNCFTKFDDRNQVSNARIVTWKVDYQCTQDGNVLFKEA